MSDLTDRLRVEAFSAAQQALPIAPLLAEAVRHIEALETALDGVQDAFDRYPDHPTAAEWRAAMEAK